MIKIISKLTAMGYRMELSGDKIVLEYVGEGNPDPAVKDLIPELTAHKPVLKRLLAVMSAVDGDLVKLAEDTSTVEIWAEDLLYDKTLAPATCFNCGQTQWWTKPDGQRACDTCHPDPKNGRGVRPLIVPE